MRLAPAASVAPSRIRQIAAIAEQVPGTLRLFYGEDTLPTPEFIVRAAQQALDAGRFTYYAPNAGYPALREAIARKAGELHGIAVDPTREVVVTASGMVAIALACQATVEPGTSALVLSPLWPNIPAALRVAGADVIEVPMPFSPAGFAIDFDRLEAVVRPDTRVLAVASPSNPTGWTASADDWRRLAAFCERHDLWLLADAVYERLVFGGDRVAPSPLACPAARARTVAVHSFSKTYRMTGWRVGYAIAPSEVAARLPHLQEFVVSHPFGVTQEAARHALDAGEPFVAESLRRYERNRAIALERLRAIDGVELAVPEGAFYLFPRLAGLADSFGFCEWLVAERRVGLAPGSAFGEGGEGHVRLCFAVEEAVLIEALDRLADGWAAWRRREAR